MISNGTSLYSDTNALKLFHENEWSTPFQEIVQPRQRSSVKLSEWPKGAALGVATGKILKSDGNTFVELTMVYDHPFLIGLSPFGTAWRSVTLTAFALETDITTVDPTEAKDDEKAKKDAAFNKQLADINAGGNKGLTASGGAGGSTNKTILYVAGAALFGVICYVGYKLISLRKAERQSVNNLKSLVGNTAAPTQSLSGVRRRSGQKPKKR